VDQVQVQAVQVQAQAVQTEKVQAVQVQAVQTEKVRANWNLEPWPLELRPHGDRIFRIVQKSWSLLTAPLRIERSNGNHRPRICTHSNRRVQRAEQSYREQELVLLSMRTRQPSTPRPPRRAVFSY
jgi:hypothetical protein